MKFATLVCNYLVSFCCLEIIIIVFCL